MKYTLSQIKSLYPEIDFSKIDNTDIIIELKGVAERTQNFTKDYIIEIEGENFADLYDLVVELYPAAIGKKKEKVKEKQVSKPVAKKQDVKKTATKKVKKDRPAAKKKEKTLEELSAEDTYFEECKSTIRDRNQAKKEAKLAEYKAEKIKSLEAKGEVSDEDRAAIENLSYQDAFAKKRSITLEVTDTMFSIFEKVIKANHAHVANNSEFSGSDKSYRFKQACSKVVKIFVDTFLPELHKQLTGAKAASYIEDFNNKAGRVIAEYAEKLDKKFAKIELKEAV